MRNDLKNLKSQFKKTKIYIQIKIQNLKSEIRIYHKYRISNNPDCQTSANPSRSKQVANKSKKSSKYTKSAVSWSVVRLRKNA